ncbi:hypothetical protein QBC40DRAFT_291340 [Triangularia verruculosa]|uniref:Uncharacterized protein n=1 Tax=Triangularia verruculosa TaxID=2587418 RepID=A0AAN7APW9_9PEZI|nr:hypothetical protein QBC40DRAFT_291340 [Triangularia verruculosa]
MWWVWCVLRLLRRRESGGLAYPFLLFSFFSVLLPSLHGRDICNVGLPCSDRSVHTHNTQHTRWFVLFLFLLFNVCILLLFYLSCRVR